MLAQRALTPFYAPRRIAPPAMRVPFHDMMLPMPAGFGPFAGLKIGHAQDDTSLTGCTVFLCEAGMIAACDIRGGTTGSREIDVLSLPAISPLTFTRCFSRAAAPS